MSLEQARNSGAIALFGEKYGNEVRVVTIGDNFDKELCGGTHVPSTGHLGRVAVLSEGSIGSGVRRIDALAPTAPMTSRLRSTLCQGAFQPGRWP